MKDAIGGLLSATASAALRDLATGAATLTIAPAAPPPPAIGAPPDGPAARLAVIRIEVILGR
jgi:hypothetical protein